MNKLLLLGPRTNKKKPELTGGVIVLFEQLLSDLEGFGVKYQVIDLNSKNYPSKFAAIISIYLKIIFNIFRFKHISIHGTASVYYTIVPLIIIIAKITGKTTSLRKFAGNFNQFYETSVFVKKRIIKWVLINADFLFFETKYLVKYFSSFNKNSIWFPNVRSALLEPKLPRKYNKRFVFISHVCKGKGIDQILEASINLDKSYTVDIYGPITEGDYEESFLSNFNITYKGALKSKDVIHVLNTYDVLLLPSYRNEEGYPGIIIEAYSLGIPVISTNLKAISEICENGKEGILIEPRNSYQLTEAILSLNVANYSCFSENAYKKFNLFRSDVHTRQYLNYIDEGLIKEHEVTV